MGTLKLCKCGCGELVRSAKGEYLRGHASRHRGRTPDGKRVCPQCGRAFPETAEFFRRCRGRPGGLMGWCKGCMAERDRARDEADPESRRARARKCQAKARRERPERVRQIRRASYHRRKAEG